MCREQMLEYIAAAVEEADDRQLEQIYWMLLLELGS